MPHVRLVVISAKVFRRTADGLQTDGAFTIQMDVLADHFDGVTLCVPVVDDETFRGTALTAANIDFHPLPHYDGRQAFIRALPAIRREVIIAIGKADMGLVILPGYFGCFASWLCQRKGFPVFQWVVSDWRHTILARRRNSVTRHWTALWARTLDRLVARLTRNVLTFFTGHILYDPSSPNYFARFSSSVRSDSIHDRGELPDPEPPYNVLFVGRLSAEKGVDDLLKAISLLTDVDAVLHIVGDGKLATSLQNETEALGIKDRVRFHGFVPHGERLLGLYQSSDLLVLPSLQEQQGKVLLEAMSHSVPVVATRVGGIPSVVRDGENGLLVPPSQPEVMAAQVRRLLLDKELRRRLVRNGLESVRNRTVEAETEKMMKIVREKFMSTEGVA